MEKMKSSQSNPSLQVLGTEQLPTTQKVSVSVNWLPDSKSADRGMIHIPFIWIIPNHPELPS